MIFHILSLKISPYEHVDFSSVFSLGEYYEIIFYTSHCNTNPHNPISQTLNIKYASTKFVLLGKIQQKFNIKNYPADMILKIKNRLTPNFIFLYGPHIFTVIMTNAKLLYWDSQGGSFIYLCISCFYILGKMGSFKCFGAAPLETIVKNHKPLIMEDLENALAQQAPPMNLGNPDAHELPPLVSILLKLLNTFMRKL